MTAGDVKRLLGLAPHPREGGWYVRTYEAAEMVAAEAFEEDQYSGPRRTNTAIYYLLEADTFSEMHRLRSDEVFHFYMGDPVEMLQLSLDMKGKTIVLGTDLAKRERPQVVVKHGVWQGSRLVAGGKWALLGCTVSPGFEFEDYEDASYEELADLWPDWSEMIRALTRR
ncbi:MAG TPA: cupin domain-containing protein [Edaphobacter sp.]|nr:cupin domain-containing protein [Edaphobacter sp.]